MAGDGRRHATRTREHAPHNALGMYGYDVAETVLGARSK